MLILGISAYYHDSAACLIDNGKILAAAQEERFTRKKHDSSFPTNAIKFCLDQAGISASQLVEVVFYEKPFPKFERILETYLAFAPKGFASFKASLPVWIKDKLFQKKLIIRTLKTEFGREIDWEDKLNFSDHHLSHAASAFFPSPFRNAAVLTIDGVGEWPTTSYGIGCENTISLTEQINFPHSLGLLYSAFTYFSGFRVNSGEYKLMGLAPYGSPIFYDKIRKNLIQLNQDGSFSLNMEYFGFCTSLEMTNLAFAQLFGRKPRPLGSKPTKMDMDLAASIQLVTEEAILNLCRKIKKETNEKNLCLAGGVALNCVQTEKYQVEPFKKFGQ